MATKVKPSTNVAKTNTAALSAIVFFSADQIYPHPLNPRPWSDTYQCHVHEEKVEELIHSMRSAGYDQLEPVQVRKLADAHQIVVGHHRYCAARLLKLQIPCVVLDLDDMEVAIRLVLRQGRSIDPWDLAKHAYQLCQAENMCSQVEYGTKTGYSASLISKWVRAEQVRLATSIKGLSVTACATIARAPENCWLEIAEQAIHHKLGTREIDELVAKTQGKVLPPPEIELMTVPEILPSSEKSIELDQHLVTKTIPRNVPVGMYLPTGYKSNLRRWQQQYGSFDLILADLSILREDHQLAIAEMFKLLNKSGRVIFICEARHSFGLLTIAKTQGLELQQKLIWFRGQDHAEDLASGLWPNAYREILVFQPLGGLGYFDGLSAAQHFGIKPSDVIKLAASVNGGISATLSELLYRAYAPTSARILIPAAFEAQAILAGYRLNHRMTWLEASETLFESIMKLLPC
jgi:ParB-like chromosome segregation protein Spo0J